ncbi:MAG: hypothetical protein LQ337_007256 [Flavoplaca oasis]|nr:MAG: hypothetical protein LQ337_007256 [Flavoplaca oasis]
MFASFFLLNLCLSSLYTLSSSQSHKATPPQAGFPYKLPDGYSIERSSGVYELDPFYAYGAILVSMIELAYEDSRNLTDPVSKSYAGMTVNITGPDDTAPFYPQFATYILYHALQVLTAEQNVTVSNFTLGNDAGAVACKIVLAPASADWQELIGGFSGGISPRHAPHALPAVLETRQTSASTNESSALEALTPFYVSDWYGPESPPEDFIMALATMIVMVSDFSDKDKTINYQRAGKYGYDFNVTHVPLPGKEGYLTNRGVLNMITRAYGELTEALGFFDPVTNFETVLVWTNGTEVVNHHVLRYGGVEK